MPLSDHVVPIKTLLESARLLLADNKASIDAALSRPVADISIASALMLVFSADRFPAILLWSDGTKKIEGAGCGNIYFVTPSLVASCFWHEPHSSPLSVPAESEVATMMGWVSACFRRKPKFCAGLNMCDTDTEESSVETMEAEEYGFLWRGDVSIRPLVLAGGDIE